MYIPYSTHWSVGKRKKSLQIWSRISCVLNQKSSKSRKGYLPLQGTLTFFIFKKNWNLARKFEYEIIAEINKPKKIL